MHNYKNNTEITECQIFLTRRCNTNCGSCNLQESGKNLKELNLDEWKQVFLNLQELNIKTVKIMGGEPTEVSMPILIELIKFIKENTNIKVALLSNSKWNKDEWLDKLCDSGLYGYYASVDTVGNLAYDESSLEKSHLGYKTLLQLKENGKISLLAANVVITSKNLKSIPGLVKTLSNQGFYINLCPIQYFIKPSIYAEVVRHNKILSPGVDKNKIIDYNYRKGYNDHGLTSFHFNDLYKIIIELVKMQKDDYKIAVPEDYLIGILNYGLNGGTWKCKDFSQLRIDCDGTVMICNEFRGEKENKNDIFKGTLPNILNIPHGLSVWQADFINYWYEERLKYNCQCYWSCFLLAQNNIKTGSEEFGFVEMNYWKQIKDFPDYYINRCGLIRSHRCKIPKIIGPNIISQGYKIVTLYNDKRHVTRVIRHLIEETFNDCVVPDDFDAFCNSRGKHLFRPQKLTEDLVLKIRQDNHLTTREAGKKYGVSYQMISLIRIGKSWRHI